MLMRALPALQQPAFMSDAGDSVRRAWAAVSASVSGYLPTELPTLPRLPTLSLPKISLPQVPAISPPLGRFFSSLTTLMFAPAQIHGLAIYYQVATRNMICDPDAGPRHEVVIGLYVDQEISVKIPGISAAALALGSTQGGFDFEIRARSQPAPFIGS